MANNLASSLVGLGLAPDLAIGDFNTGDNRIDISPGASKFALSEFMQLMTDAGYTDVWRTLHPQGRDLLLLVRQGLAGIERLSHHSVSSESHSYCAQKNVSAAKPLHARRHLSLRGLLTHQVAVECGRWRDETSVVPPADGHVRSFPLRLDERLFPGERSDRSATKKGPSPLMALPLPLCFVV